MSPPVEEGFRGIHGIAGAEAAVQHHGPDLQQLKADRAGIGPGQFGAGLGPGRGWRAAAYKPRWTTATGTGWATSDDRRCGRRTGRTAVP